MPRAREFLHFCRRHGLRTALLSTLHRRHFEAQAGPSGFAALLDRAYVEVMDKRQKIREILEENNFAPGETLFVGDMAHDIETARHGGVYACAVLTGYNNLDQLRASHPDLIVEHLGELADILLRGNFELDPAAPRELPAFPVSTVGALIHNSSGEVLMIRTQKWSDLWGIPGGKIKYGEPALDALRREIMEETGLEIEQPRFVTVQDCVESPEFYRRSHFLLLNYTARAVEPCAVRLNEEAHEFRWVTPADALRLPLNGPTKVLLDLVAAPQSPNDCVLVKELRVEFRVGVPEEERARPQKLLINLDLKLDTRKAAALDCLDATVNYHQVCQRIAQFGEGRAWKLIETLASDIATLLLREFPIAVVVVEVQKFILPETRHVAVRIERTRI
jgi:FolB domain-containing protein